MFTFYFTYLFCLLASVLNISKLETEYFLLEYLFSYFMFDLCDSSSQHHFLRKERVPFICSNWVRVSHDAGGYFG